MEEVILKNIDEFIENSHEILFPDRFFNDFADLIIQYFELDVKVNKGIETITNKELSSNKKRFIAVCILRIYSINPRIITNTSNNHHILKFLENAIPEIFSELGINEKAETYAKNCKLEDYIKNKEKKISEEADFNTNLLGIASYKHSYIRAIFTKNNQAIISHFFSERITKPLFEKCFNIVIRYIDSPVENKYSIYCESLKSIEILTDLAQTISTKYCIDYVSKPLTKLKEALIYDFQNNPCSKPAKLIVKNTEKKYPFAKGDKSKFQLILEDESSGIAFKSSLKINEYESKYITIETPEQFVGDVSTSTIIDFDYIVNLTARTFIISGTIEWFTFDGNKLNDDFILELIGQNANVDWEELQFSKPYDLEPVEHETELIGRKNIINDLKANTKNKLGSSYVYGQRRVGKTSIVKTLKSSIDDKNLLVIYFEAGDWNNAKSPYTSMDDLGKKICTKIKRSNRKFDFVDIPDFGGSFSRITDFLDQINEIDEKFSVLIILDEFDRIASELYKRGDIGQSFLLTIRAISSRPQYGFILVGGEKLAYILSQWQEFNKFKPIRVDYFDKKEDWTDFKNLVKLPTNNILEITDEAVDYIFKQTSGNPYFTKKICIELFSYMVKNRDNHVTLREAIHATHIARDSNNIEATDFSHFWEDGIKEKEEKEEEISVNRRKILITIAQLIIKNFVPTKSIIIERALENGLSELQAIKTLEEFEQRRILYIENESYKFVVKFFEDWLVSCGIDKIITTFDEVQRIILQKKFEDEIRVKPQEILKLSQSWKTYKGAQITTDSIRSWLEQFADESERRLMFSLLEKVKLYNSFEIREKLTDLFSLVKIELNKADKSRILEQGKMKRNDILVSYLDANPAKSSSEYAKLFVEANSIYKDNSTAPDKIVQKVDELKSINAIVFIDDFIGSGKTIIENLGKFINQNGDFIKSKQIILIIGVITGFQEAKQKIEVFIDRQDLNCKIKLLVPLNNSDKCFDESSLIFAKAIDREKAKNTCLTFGSKLEPKHPLGYENCQSIVVFPNTCPNNSLPILWKETKDWTPLFKRG